jgi:hypothetical protein
MTSQNEEILDACASGDVAALRRLFQVMAIRKGSKPVYIETSDKEPPIDSMLVAAITNGNLDIVSYLLETYENIKFYDSVGVIMALLHHPDLAILEALYKHDSDIVNFQWDNYRSTFLTEACEQPPEKIGPLIRFLVEHDVELWIPEGIRVRVDGAIYEALCGNQANDVIEAMIRKGGPVGLPAAKLAVGRERVDVLELFIKYDVELQDVGLPAGDRESSIQRLQSEAEETGNTDVIKLVNTWTSKWKDNTVRKDRTGEGPLGKAKGLFGGVLFRKSG